MDIITSKESPVLFKIEDIKHLPGTEFENEAELCDYIDRNTAIFATEVLDIVYGSHKREFGIDNNKRQSNKRATEIPRCDFLFTSKEGENILVECKCPSASITSLNYAFGQILSYYCLCKRNNIIISRICLISTRLHSFVIDVIKEFNLPIELYLINKAQTIRVA